ncbi:MATE family efflux transporter [Anaeromicrobium sediminis]|uniref:MATE family efflux transporter n=1 Tax=Anaeromicrobium sediminis TaxID=1478221 RepID=A0A267MIH0_9FIRM|nr:MATE family efflux transporter [Anaeromicrobium sediminis]PAB59326.1 MATE family efflux transporter [Anaeromicrobium sediminis]
MNDNTQNPLGVKPILPLIIKLSIPSIISMFVQALYNVVDSIFVSRISETALAALSLAFPIQLILIAMGVGTGIGTSSLISRLLGMKEYDKASNTALHVVLISFIYGTITALVGYFFVDDIVGTFTSDKILIGHAISYIQPILLGSIAVYLPTIGNNILRGEGNTFIPMVTMLIGSVLNIILDPILIFGYGPFPEMGVAGAAIATIASRIISGSFIIWVLLSNNNRVKFNIKKFNFDKDIIRKLYAVALPAITMQCMASFMISSFNYLLSDYGESAISAMGIYIRLQSFVFMPVFGLNQGYIPIMGYNYGHKHPNRMKEAMKYATLIAFTFTTIGTIIFQLFPENLILLFGNSEELLSIGTKALTTISIAFPIIGPAIIGSTTFQALGFGIPSLILSFLRQMILLLPVGYLLNKLGGLDYIWFSFPISEVISFIVMIIWLTSTLKKVFLKLEKDN